MKLEGINFTDVQIKKAFDAFKSACEAAASPDKIKDMDLYMGKADGMMQVFKIFGLNEQLDEYLEED